MQAKLCYRACNITTFVIYYWIMNSCFYKAAIDSSASHGPSFVIKWQIWITKSCPKGKIWTQAGETLTYNSCCSSSFHQMLSYFEFVRHWTILSNIFIPSWKCSPALDCQISTWLCYFVAFQGSIYSHFDPRLKLGFGVCKLLPWPCRVWWILFCCCLNKRWRV